MNINYIDFSNTTRFHDDGDVPYITFRKFDGLDFIKHGFSTRLGGVSKGIYESMDLTFTRGDDPDAVRENFRLIGRWGAFFGFWAELLISGRKIWSMQCRRTQPT